MPFPLDSRVHPLLPPWRYVSHTTSTLLVPSSWEEDTGEKDVVGVIIKCCDSAHGQEEQDKQVQCFLCHLILLRIIFLSVVEFEQLSATIQEYHTNDHMMEEERRSSSVRQSTFKVRPTGPLSIGSGPSDLFPLMGYIYSQA